MNYVILYNPISGGGNGLEHAKKLEAVLPGDTLTYEDVTAIKDIKAYFAELGDKTPVLFGGDGTLNHFINDIDVEDITGDILFYPNGSGNDFWSDINPEKVDKPLSIKKYLVNLPIVTVNGKDYRFINGVGYGIDGYCCEVGDEERAKSDKPVNYTAIAIKGLLFFFHPADATVIIDGVEKKYKKVWLAPTMHGRLYGGGMIPIPTQKRNNAEHIVSIMVWHSSLKLKTLMIFPNIFKGEHISHKKYIEIYEGHDITVKFTKPTALQIDGETIKNVTEYHVRTV